MKNANKLLLLAALTTIMIMFLLFLAVRFKGVQIAATTDSPTICRIAIFLGGNPVRIDKRGNMPIHSAVFFKSTKTMQVLLDHCSVNQANRFGDTPLDLANQLSPLNESDRGRIAEVIKYLKENGGKSRFEIETADPSL